MGDCGRARYLPYLIALLSLFVQPLHIHTHYTVGGKCIHHQHIMDTGSTLQEFDARFLYGNCELFIDSCVIGQMLVVYFFDLIWFIQYKNAHCIT